MLMMEPSPGSAEELPALYRSILSLVEELERCDGRAEAERIRRHAITAYSTGWDPRQRRRLEQLEAQVQRAIHARRRRPRTWFRLP